MKTDYLRARPMRTAILGAAIAAVAMLGSACVEDPPPAPAALSFESAASGNVHIDIDVPENNDDPENPIPGYTIPVEVPLNGTAAGSWQHGGSGAFQADLTFANDTFGIDVPNVGLITVGYSAQAQPATGNFDPATGLGGFNTDLTMTVLTIDALGGDVTPPCDVVFNLALTGQIDPGTGILTVTQSGFTVLPPANDDCGGLGGIMGQLLGGPLNSSSLSFEVGTI